MLMTRIKKSLSLIVCGVLIAVISLFASGCDSNKNHSESSVPVSYGEISELGEGETQFIFTVTDVGGEETVYRINTDKTTVGEALLELELIDGDEGEYGLYVKTVNGITVDYDKDGKYWAFYIDGKYANTGVDATNITPGATYSLKVE